MLYKHYNLAQSLILMLLSVGIGPTEMPHTTVLGRVYIIVQNYHSMLSNGGPVACYPMGDQCCPELPQHALQCFTT